MGSVTFRLRLFNIGQKFQLTRSVGSVTQTIYNAPACKKFQLTRSVGSVTVGSVDNTDLLCISTHTLRGERDSTYCICEVTPPQQSGHFTKNHFKKRYFLHNMYYFFSEPPYKPISLHVRSQNQTALRIICFLCTYMLHSPLPIITQIIESKAILFFINNFHKSIF